MYEQLHQPTSSPEINPERMIVVKRYLREMKTPKDIEVGEFVKVIGGEYVGRGMLVLEKKSDGSITATENPHGGPTIVLQQSDVSHFADYDEAVRHALHDVPLTVEERPRPPQSDPRLRVAKREKH